MQTATKNWQNTPVLSLENIPDNMEHFVRRKPRANATFILF